MFPLLSLLHRPPLPSLHASQAPPNRPLPPPRLTPRKVTTRPQPYLHTHKGHQEYFSVLCIAILKVINAKNL